MHSSLLLLAVLLSSLGDCSPLDRRASTPSLPYDESTVSTCNSWIDNASGAIPCIYIPLFYGITSEQFFEWNPVLKDSCDNYATGVSYCVGVGSAATTTTATTSSTTTSSSTTTPTTSSIMSTTGTTSTTPTTPTSTTSTATTGIATPTPTQPGMVDGCTAFYYVESGTWCALIAEEVGVSTDDIIAWNPSVGDDCSALWADVYICIGVDSSTPATSTTTSATTTTSTGDGITTPTPTQDGMVDNCDEFHYVESGESCWSISQDEGIELADVLEWNTGVGEDCTNLWAETYMCIGVSD